MYACIYIYTHIHMYVHIYTYIHIYIYRERDILEVLDYSTRPIPYYAVM